MSSRAEPLQETPRRERAINAPWTVTALILVLVGAHGLRVLAGVEPEVFAITSTDMASGRFFGLISYQFVHGGWAHVMMNAAFVLAFGAPVARLLGGGLRGAAAFFCFFLLCGVVAAVVYDGWASSLAWMRGGRVGWILVGASGAASGLMGAAARIIQGRGRLGPMFGRTVSGMTIGWIVVNVVLGTTGLTPGAAGAQVAWEAHIFGYVCGLIMIGLFSRLAGVKTDHANAL